MKWWGYLICAICVIAGVICSVFLYQTVRAKSYVNGDIDISNKFVQESFCYVSSSVVLAEDKDIDGCFTFDKELLPVESFNGEKNDYKIQFNDYEFFDVDITAGTVKGNYSISFYDENNKLLCYAPFGLDVTFLSNKTLLKISTVGEKEAQFLNQYFADNGLTLKIIEVI